MSVMLMVLAPLLALSGSAMADRLTECSCDANRRFYPQKEYCEADFVLKANILDKQEDTVNQEIVYKLFVQEILKGRTGGIRKLRMSIGFVVTSTRNLRCTSFFPVGATHLISGQVAADGRLTTSYCNLNPPWLALTDTELKGVTGSYLSHCRCEVERCSAGIAEFLSCYARNSICSRINKRECQFSDNADLQSCIDGQTRVFNTDSDFQHKFLSATVPTT